MGLSSSKSLKYFPVKSINPAKEKLTSLLNRQPIKSEFSKTNKALKDKKPKRPSSKSTLQRKKS